MRSSVYWQTVNFGIPVFMLHVLYIIYNPFLTQDKPITWDIVIVIYGRDKLFKMQYPHNFSFAPHLKAFEIHGRN